MASFNSFSFALEMPMESSSIQLGPRMLLYRQKKAVGCEGRSDLRVGGLSFMWGSQGWGCKRGALRKIEIVKATGKDSVEGEDKEEAEDALQATIEKSKKVLAMQSQLLQQIAERRQIVSSIKSSITDAGDEEVSFKETEVSNVDRGSDGTTESNGYLDGSDGMKPEISTKESENSIIGIGLDNTTEDKGHLGGSKGTQPADIKYTSRTLSSENVYSDASMVSESQTSASHSSSREGRGEGVRDLWQKLNVDSSRPIEDVIELPKKSPSEFDESSDASNKEAIESLSRKKMAFEVASPEKTEEVSAVPNFLLKTAEPSPLTDEKDWDSKQSTTRELSDKVDDPVQEAVKPPPPAGVNVMNVILVAAECAPWSKTGGLGDVAGALPKALARRGHRVMVVAPCYGDYTEPQDTGVRKRYRVDGQDMEVCYFQAYIDGVDFVFIESPMFRHIGNNIYGGSRLDILKRMVLFCKAAVEVPWHVPCGGVCYGDGNLVFIANDWHTALLPVYLKAYCRDNGMMTFTRSVLVIHNIAHQGRGPVDDFSYVDLPEHYLDYFKLCDPIGGDHFNIFAAGLKAADRIVTVSHGYAWELKTSEGGWGLHNIINESNWKLRGIVNGIDTKEWNPQFDVHLKSDGYTNYSLDTLKTGKAQCKAALQKELGLAVRDDIPLIGFIGRLDVQKGVDIIGEAIPWMMGQDVQLVMLGSGRPDLEHMLRQFDSQYHDKIRGWVGFSVKTAHRITAGADILLMPSRFEPCGLNQLYAMSYGTVPVVHAVGGLRDTVQQFDPFNESGVGWTFDRAESNKLINALGNCLLTYREYKKSWEGLQRRGMTKDLSWDNAALQYEEVLVAAKFQW